MSNLTWWSHSLSVHSGVHLGVVECGRRSPKRGVILFWSNLLCGSEQTPFPLCCSESQLSNAGLGLSAFPAPVLHSVALLPWAGAWLRHGKQCTGHWSRILCLPKALSLGPLQVICQQQPRAKQVKTSARPPSTVQPTLQTHTMLQSLSTGPTMAPPKVVCPTGEPRPEPCRLHQGHGARTVTCSFT